VLLLHCLRQQQYKRLTHQVKKADGKVKKELDLAVSAEEGGQMERVVWPKTPRDFTPEMCEAKGCKVGGFDLSDGAEPLPVEWINEVDSLSPPPFVYVARCVAADVHPDWLGKRAQPCSFDPNCKEAVTSKCDCTDPKFSGLAARTRGQCNWSCHCPATCEGRTMQRGVGVRLQVFKHEGKGWCLRTLSPISKGDFIMEYVGERVSQVERKRREDRAADMGTYEMDTDEKNTSEKKTFICAFHVRNIAAFAAFACRKKMANMARTRTLCQHWDRDFVHVVFSATEDVPAGTELTYMRCNEGDPPSSSTYNCKCAHPECSERF